MVIIVDERDLSQVQDYCNILALYPSVQLKLAHQGYFIFFSFLDMFRPVKRLMKMSSVLNRKIVVPGDPLYDESLLDLSDWEKYSCEDISKSKINPEG